jgi:hypothetical protein
LKIKGIVRKQIPYVVIKINSCQTVFRSSGNGHFMFISSVMQIQKNIMKNPGQQEGDEFWEMAKDTFI